MRGLTNLLRPCAGRVSSTPARQALARAVVCTTEALESRLFLHAGDHLAPLNTFPLNGQQSVATSSNVTVTFSTDINVSTLSANSFELRDQNNAVVPATYRLSGSKTILLDPAGSLSQTNGYFTAIVKGGAGSVTDVAGNGLDDDIRFGFTTGKAQFTQTQVLGGLVKPVAMDFASDGRVVVAERSGLVQIFDSLTDTSPTTVADLRTHVHNFWDRGLLGLAVHPNFPAKPYIYLLYTYDGDIGGPAPKFGSQGVSSDPGPDATGNGAHVSGRLSRITVSGNTMVPGSELVLVHDWQQQFPGHSVGSVVFGPDGALYASAGEGANFSYADYGQTGNPFNDPVNEGGSLRAQDVRTPNDPTSLDGSIIRVNPDTGAALPDNPMFTTGDDANAKRIVAYGFRNPFRVTFRPGTNEIWVGDVGPSTWEEIDRVTLSSTKAQNFGWPAYEGDFRQPGFDGLNLPLIEGLYAEGPSAVVSPYYSYRRGQPVVPNSGEVSNASISGLAFYDGHNYPLPYQGALFFADFVRNAIYVMHPGLDGLPNRDSREILHLGNMEPVQIVTGPAGDMFVVDLNGKIWRFSYNSTNRPPTAVITSDVTSGSAPLTVKFSAASSSDPDPTDTLSYNWDLNGDGTFGDSTSITPTHTYVTAGSYVVKLRVTDSRGSSATTQLTIQSGNNAPQLTVDEPLANLNWKVGDTIAFAGSASDQEQGTLAASGLNWTLIIRHGSPDGYHEHVVQTWAGVASGSFIAPDHEYPSSLELRVTATDAGSLTDTESIVLSPVTTTLSFTSETPGARISYNGEQVATPFSRTAIIGSTNSIAAITPQLVGDTYYGFASWSDGGLATHQIVAPPTAATYAAEFNAVPPPPPTGGAKVNFQPASAPGVSGYLIDAGQTFAARNGASYGWTTSHADVTFDRGVNATQLVDTHVAVKNGAKWELAVPNGQYVVKVGIGDSGAGSTNNVWIESAEWVYQYVSLGSNQFRSDTRTVAVSDGRLTLSFGNTANLATRLDYVEVSPVGSPPPPPTSPPPPPTSPPPTSPPPTSPPPTSPPPTSPPPTSPPPTSPPPTSPPSGGVRVNFQPTDAPTVDGYLPDGGLTFAARNGASYGWTTSHAEVAFDRDANSNQLLDTHVAAKSGAKWELALPNGTYQVKVGVGDSGAGSTNNVWIEGAEWMYQYLGLGGNQFRGDTASIAVSDGRLTLSFGKAANLATRLTYVEVTGGTLSPPPASPPPTSPPPTSPPPTSPPPTSPPPTSPPPTAPPPTAPPPPTSSDTFARVNFQPSGSAVADYLVDAGGTFGARGGQSYGWSVSHAAHVVDRNANSDQLLDTHIAMQAKSRWELAVPNGTYSVKVVAGDAAAASNANIWVEGNWFYEYVGLGAGQFLTDSITVTVTDGRLTLGVGGAANSVVRLSYVDITRI